MALTPGQALHYDLHYRRQRKAVSARLLPGVRGGSVIEYSASKHREDTNPPKEWVDAIDARWGRTDWQQDAIEAEARLAASLIHLAAYDPLMADLVHVVCLNGRTDVARGRGLTHHDILAGARLIAPAERPDEDLDDRAANKWLAEAWELIAVLQMTPAERRGEALLHDAAAAALHRLKGQGLL